MARAVGHDAADNLVVRGGLKSQPAVEVLSSLERTPVGVPLGLDPDGSHPWESAYHGLHGHRRGAATRPERRSRIDAPQTRGGATSTQMPAEPS